MPSAVEPNGGSGGALVPVVPARLFESRYGEVTVDHLFEGGGRVAAGSVTEVQVVDRGGVGVDASAVVLNVTAVGPSAPGFLTVFPCDDARPLASNVNYQPGDVVPNAVVAKVGAGGKVCMFSLAETDLVVDVNAWFGPDPNAPQPSAETLVLPAGVGEVGEEKADGTRIVTTTSASSAMIGGFIVTEYPDSMFYGRVLSVEGDQVVAEPATLADIYPDLTFDYATDLGTVTNNLAEVQLSNQTELDCTDSKGGVAQVWVTPVVELGRFEADIDWTLIGGITRMRMVYAPRLALTVESSVGIELDCALEYDIDLPLELPAIRFMIGPVPVIITQDLDLELRLAMQVEAAAETSAAVSGGLALGFDCIDGSCSLVKDSFLTTGSSTTLTTNGRLEAQLLLEYGAKAYGFIGLEGEIKPYFGLVYSNDENKYPSLEAGVKAGLNFVVELHKWLRYEEVLLEKDVFGPIELWSRLEVPRAPGAVLSGLPANAQFVAYGGKKPYTFSGVQLPPGLTLSASGLLTGTSPAPGGYDVEFTVRDSGSQIRTKTLRLTVNEVTPEISARFGKVVELPDGRSWYIDKRGSRHHIPDGGTYQCLTAQGVQVEHVALFQDLQWYTELEAAQCVTATIGDIVRISGNKSYLVADGWKARSIPDGGTFMCLDVNGADVYDVPVYWVYDLGFGADYSWSCWNATTARGKSVRASDGTSYYIDLRGGRHWMPNGGTYDCLVAQGKSDYGNIVPKDWVDDLPEYENAKCVHVNPGNIIRHADNDAYLINANWTRSWIADGGSYECLRLNGHTVVDLVPRYYIDDLAQGTNVTSSCWNAVAARGKSVRASDGTAWYIDLRGGRHWMPDGGTYNCLVAQGKSDWGYVVPISWVDDLTQYENAKCVNASPGNIISHVNGDSYLINPNWTRSWIKDGGIYNCLTGAGHAVVSSVPRYYIDDITAATDLTFCPADRVLRMTDGTAWYVGNDLVKHPIANGGTYLCMTAWKGKQVVTVTLTQANLFTSGTNQSCTVTEANDRVIKVGATSWYVDTSGVKHPIPNGGTYLCLTAWKGKVAWDVSQEQADAIPTGANQSCTVTEANNEVIKLGAASWYVDTSGVKHPIPNAGIYYCLTAWKGKATRTVTQGQADAIPTGANQTCTVSEVNNRVIKVGAASWYVDTGGVKHPIPNGGTYLCMTTWKGKQVVNVTQEQAWAIPEGGNQSCSATEASNRLVRTSAGTVYYVDTGLVKHWVPNGGTYNCALNVRGIPLINNVTQGHADALTSGSNYRCRAIIQMQDYSFYVDSSGYRFLIPNSRNQDPYLCLRNKPGVYVRSYSTWAQVDALGIPDRTGVHAACYYD